MDAAPAPPASRDVATRESLGLDGSETIDLTDIAGGLEPRLDVDGTITRADGATQAIKLSCRIDTLDEVEYYRNGGILQYVLRNMAQAA